MTTESPQTNHFAYSTAAKRYAKGRPYFHPIVIERIQDFTKQTRFENGIDVCCGTGQSSQALRTITDRVVGVDNSQGMLNEAIHEYGLEYLLAPAENLPVESGAFDIMTVSLAFHWLQREQFLQEAHRVLKPGEWLILSNNSFKGRMEGNSEYEAWNKNSYLERYPSPPRNKSPFTAEDAKSHGFELAGEEKYLNDVSLSLEELACYLTTQSNMIAAIDSGKESFETAQEWLLKELKPLFTYPRETFHFNGSITYLKRGSSLVTR